MRRRGLVNVIPDANRCKLCAERWMQSNSNGLCRQCFRVCEDDQRKLVEIEAREAERARTHPVRRAPEMRPPREVVIDGVAYWVMND